jgi:hypothetical protein
MQFTFYGYILLAGKGDGSSPCILYQSHTEGNRLHGTEHQEQDNIIRHLRHLRAVGMHTLTGIQESHWKESDRLSDINENRKGKVPLEQCGHHDGKSGS